ncbi:hypothetical protein SAMN05216476_4012 [Pseudomonas mediterranea]|uniref:Uncharacterized protein n=1 Tax=Pseudomonas mediterranea TaxID=183795 RepID=A0AAX2DG91_9PSED|nr:hypothetical protein SAMN05216476_4012 [Pseudomonas mediterranea]
MADYLHGVRVVELNDDPARFEGCKRKPRTFETLLHSQRCCTLRDSELISDGRTETAGAVLVSGAVGTPAG